MNAVITAIHLDRIHTQIDLGLDGGHNLHGGECRIVQGNTKIIGTVITIYPEWAYVFVNSFFELAAKNLTIGSVELIQE